jgi:hypothetical protein
MPEACTVCHKQAVCHLLQQCFGCRAGLGCCLEQMCSHCRLHSGVASDSATDSHD